MIQFCQSFQLLIVLLSLLSNNRIESFSSNWHYQPCVVYKDLRDNLRSVLILPNRIFLVTQQTLIYETRLDSLDNGKLSIKYNQSFQMENRWPQLFKTQFEVIKHWFTIAISVVSPSGIPLVALIYKDNLTYNKEVKVLVITDDSENRAIRTTHFRMDFHSFIQHQGAFITTLSNEFYSIQFDSKLRMRQLYFTTWLPFLEDGGSSLSDIIIVPGRRYYIFYEPIRERMLLSTENAHKLALMPKGFVPMTGFRFYAGFISPTRQLFLFSHSYLLKLSADILKNVSRVGNYYYYDNISIIDILRPPCHLEQVNDLLLLNNSITVKFNNSLLKIVLPVSILGLILLASIAACAFSKCSSNLANPSSKIESEIGSSVLKFYKPDRAKSKLMMSKSKSVQQVSRPASLNNNYPFTFAHFKKVTASKSKTPSSFKLSKLSKSNSKLLIQ